MSSSRNQAWWFWGLILLILMAALGLRLFRLDFQDIWWDEARNIDVATRDLAHVATAPELDIHPPLYFETLHAWTRLAGTSPFATRFLSTWFGMLTLALTYALARQLVSQRLGALVGLWALVLAAFAPYGLAEAQETRMYTMTWALLAAGMMALLWALAQEGNWFRWVLFGALAGLALITHYGAIFILAAWAVWLLAWALWPLGEHLLGKSTTTPWPRVRARIARLAVAAGVVMILFLPVIPIAWRQIPGYDNPNLTLPTLSGYLSQLYRAFTLGEFVPPQVWAWGKWGVGFGILVGAGLALAPRSRQSGSETHWRPWSLLFIWGGGGLALFYLVLIARSEFNPRYISFILPAGWTLAGWALMGWRRLARPAPWLVLAGILAFTIPSLHADLFDPAHFREDMTGVVTYLQAHATPDDIILVDQRYPFGFYWRRWNNAFDGTPPAQPADQAPAQYLFVDADRIDQRLTDLAGNARRVFYVTWYESDMDPRGFTLALLDAYGQRIAEQAFRGYTVRTWRMHPPTHFRLPRDFTSLSIPFDPGITLVAGDWWGRATPLQPGRPILVLLHWQGKHPTDRPYKVSLRLKDASGATLAQDDRLLLSNRHLRTTAWAPGEEALTVYLLPGPTAPGTYTLSVVLYDEATLAATGTQDGRGAEPVIGRVEVK